MKYFKDVLKNGVRLMTIPMPSLPSVSVCIWVKTGSRNEDLRVNGITHFLEHMVFKGSKKRPTAKAISEVIDGIGGEFNAGTGKEYTNFYVKCQNESVEVAYDILSDMILNPILDSEEIEREKGTIVEEIRMYEDTPMMKIGDVFEELIYKGHSLGWDISGTEKSVKGIKREDFIKYMKQKYIAQSIVVTVAGGITEAKSLELTKKYFSELKGKSGQSDLEVFNSKQQKAQVLLHNKKKEQAHFILGFMADGRGYKGKYAQSVLSAILGGGMSSRMFIEVRERRGLAYAVRTSMDRYIDAGYMGTYVGADVAKAEEAVKVVLEQHYGVATGNLKISTSELSKAKAFLKGHLALALEDTRDVASFYGEQELFLPSVKTPEEVFKAIDKVKLEDVNLEAKRLFVPERLNLALIGPYKSDEKFKKIIS